MTITAPVVAPMTPLQRYMFDVQGYVVLRGVLDRAQVAEIKELLVGQAVSDAPACSRSVMDDGSIRLGDFLQLGQPLRDLLDHPAVTGILNELVAPGFRLDHFYAMHQPKGTGLLPLHGGGNRRGSDFYMTALGDQLYSGLTVVSWALTDSPAEGGGFLCVPGSHKANFELPGFLDAFYRNELIDFEEDPDFVRRVRVDAGDVIVFTEALCHAAEPWPRDDPRLAVLYKYCPGPLCWSEYVPPGPDLSACLTEQQRHLFAPPHASRPRPAVGLPGALT